MKADFTETWMIEMRQAYLATADDKIAELSCAVRNYVQDPMSDVRRQQLHRLLHNLIGSGGSYGVPEVSMAARSMSDALKRLQSSGDNRDLYSLTAELQDGLEKLRQAFRSS